MKNDLQAGLQNIIDAINNLIEPKLGSLRYDKTFRAKVISDEGNNTYGVQINGKNYKAVYTGEKIAVGQIVRVKAPLNNFSDIYIETLPSSGSGEAGNYNTLLNKPILNTNNTGTQVPSATETIQGTISLHKVSKTGNYNDLLNKPTLDFIPTSEKGAANGVAGLDGNKKVSKSNLPTDTVYDNNYVHTDNNFTTAMKNKLDSVEEGAEPNKIEIIQRNGSVLPINNKTVNVEVPTKTSDLANNGDGTTGSKYITNSDLNIELGNKQNKITGGATTIVTNDLTVNRALVSNANGKVAVSNTTSTELGYLSGARSNLQTQIDTITTEGGQPNVIEVIQENGTPLEIANKTVNIIAPTNLQNGTALGTLRTVTSSEESDNYKLGECAFAEGQNTVAQGYASHAEGNSTIANGINQHVQGELNIPDTTSLDIVGNGDWVGGRRSNAYTLDPNGNGWFSGEVYVGSTSGTNKDSGSIRLAKISELDAKVDKTTTIAGINLQDNITVTELVDALKIEMLKIENPVGHIRMETTNTNPATYLGFGTWVLWGSGRVPVGVDTTDNDFQTVERTGGSKTVNISHSHTIASHNHGGSTGSTALTINQIPAHTHDVWQTSGGSAQSTEANALSGATVWSRNLRNVPNFAKSEGGGAGHSHTIDASGQQTTSTVGSTALSLLQSYITCYMWKRTA